MTDTASSLTISTDNGVQTWTMAGAPANAINPELLGAIDAQLQRAEADTSISVVVLTSGLRIFSAGGDASWMARVHAESGADGLVDQFNEAMDYFREVCSRIRRSPLLVIAALNGHTLAGGLELAVACDFRFAADSERLQIGVPEMDLFGAVPTGGGGAQYLARLLGPTKALKFILDAKPVSPQIALAMGLVDQLHEPAALLAETQSYAAGIAHKAGRIGVAAAKRIILDGAELPLSDALQFERPVHWDAMRRGNFKTGVAAFIARFGTSK
jgi:enoyl-CoA hydratase/carnithine racemase